MLDGTPVTGRHTNTSMLLEGVPRGSHVLQALLLDESGRNLASSDSMRFYMRQASRLDPLRQDSGDPNPPPGASPIPPGPVVPSVPNRPTGPAGNAFQPAFSPSYNR
jgi:hypothetical protein